MTTSEKNTGIFSKIFKTDTEVDKNNEDNSSNSENESISNPSSQNYKRDEEEINISKGPNKEDVEKSAQKILKDFLLNDEDYINDKNRSILLGKLQPLGSKVIELINTNDYLINIGGYGDIVDKNKGKIKELEEKQIKIIKTFKKNGIAL